MIDVLAFDELEEGVPVAVVAAGREIALARWGNSVYALRNVCPHQSQSFVCGNVRARLRGAGAPGRIAADADDPVLRCPWHAWEFRLGDGRCTTDPRLRVRTYPTEVRDGRVLVDMGALEAAEAKQLTG